jgi:RNA polymerase sigma-70 factor (ECF subfamily)
LVSRALSEDSVAFEELVKRHMPAVSAVAMAYTKNQSDAEDVVQESFLKAWQQLNSLRTPRRFGAWIVSIARNVARGLHNKKRRESEKRDRFQAETERDDKSETVSYRDELKDLLPALVSELSETDRELILLRYQSGKKAKEIAQLLEMSDAAVRKRIQRIRAKLGQTLLVSLQPNAVDQKREEKRAVRIASIVTAIPPTWKTTVPKTNGFHSTEKTMLPKIIAGTTVVTIIIALAYFGNRMEVPAVEEVETTTPQRSATTIDENNLPPIQISRVETDDQQPDSQMPATSAAVLASISGRIYEEDTGNPIADVAMDLVFHEPRSRHEAVTDDDGRYTFTNLKPGRISMYAGGNNFRDRYPLMTNKSVKKTMVLDAGDELEDIDFFIIRGLTVAGVVLSPGGEPLAGAKMTVRTGPDEMPFESKTDKEGRFLLNGFGTHRPGFFWPHYEGYAMVPHGPVKIPPEGVDSLQLRMVPESTITGRIIDYHGTPMPDVRITPWPRGHSYSNGEIETTTDDKGQFVLSGLHETTYRISIRLPGDTSSSKLSNVRNLKLGQAEHLLDVEWIYESPGDFTISGRVTDDVGKPLRGQRITADGGSVFRRAETDDDGYYTLTNLSGGTYAVEVEYSSPRVTATGGSQNVDLVVKRKGTMRGNIIDAATLEPIQSFELTNPTYLFNWYDFQHPEGYFEMNFLFPGQQTITARAPGYAMGRSEVYTLYPGEVIEGVIVKLEKAGTVLGRVTDPEGNPVRDATVGNAGLVFSNPPRTNAKGEFIFSQAKPGLNTIVLSHPDFAPTKVEVEVVQGEETVVDVQFFNGAQLSGVLRGRDRPIGGEQVEFTQRAGDGLTNYHKYSKTDHNGRFEFSGVPIGDFLLHVNPIYGGRGQVIDIPITISGTETLTQDIELHVSDAFAIFSVEMDEELESQDGRIYVSLEYFFENGEKEEFYTSNLETAGNRMNGLRPGVAKLTARYTGVAFHEPLATIEPREVTIQEGVENHFTLEFSKPID